MFQSLRSRLWLSYVALIIGVLCLVGAGLAIYLVTNPSPTRSLYLRLESIASIFVQAERLVLGQDENRLEQAILRADMNFNARFTILSPDGSVLIDSRQNEQTRVLLPPQRILEERSRIPLTFRDSNNRIWVYASRYLDDGNILIVSSPRPRITVRELLQDELYIPLFRAGLAAFALSVILAIWISTWISGPLRRMVESINKVADGPYSPIETHGPSEVRELAIAFNEMSKRVQASQQSQKEFIANVSHDLKTPLTVIQGFAQAILDGTSHTAQELNQAGHVILDEATRMHRMVIELLDLARIDSGIVTFARDPIDLTKLLNEVTNQILVLAKQKKIDLIKNILPVPLLIGDYDRLAQAFTNLLDNAVKYTPEGGKVFVSIKRFGNHVAVQISDGGPGIPAEQASRIFDRFYQIDKSRSSGSRHGFGLGLAIAHEIITVHHGTIHIESNQQIKDIPDLPSQGSTFTVRIPYADLSSNLH